MLFHIVAGFVIPWIVSGFILRDKIKLLLVFVPFVMATSFFINQFGFNFFWRLDVRFTAISLAAIPYDVGLYPILGCLFIFFIHYKKQNKTVMFFLFIVITTIMELMGVLFGKVIYRNDWNIGWTAVSYTLAYAVIYLYYRMAIKYKIFG